GILAHPLIDESVVEFLEPELEVLAGVRARPAGKPQTPVVVHPLEVHGVAGVLLALKPIAGNVREDNFAKAVFPGERLPDGELRRRLWPHIGPQQPGAFLHRISDGRATLLCPRARINQVVVRLLDAASTLVHQPAVVIAADASVFDEAIREVGAAMRTMAVEEPETSALILIEHEIFAHQADGLDGVLLQFARAADRHPIAAQKLTHWSFRADAQHTDLATMLLLQLPIV